MNIIDLIVDAPYLLGKDHSIIGRYTQGAEKMIDLWNDAKELEHYDYDAHRKSLLPKLKKGDPIVVWNVSEYGRYVRKFLRVNRIDPSYTCTFCDGSEDESNFQSWTNWEPLPGYDYQGEEDE